MNNLFKEWYVSGFFKRLWFSITFLIILEIVWLIIAAIESGPGLSRGMSNFTIGLIAFLIFGIFIYIEYMVIIKRRNEKYPMFSNISALILEKEESIQNELYLAKEREDIERKLRLEKEIKAKIDSED